MDEKWIQNVLGEKICENGVYNEDVVRDKVDQIFVFSKNLEIRCKDESVLSIKLLQIFEHKNYIGLKEKKYSIIIKIF